MSDVPHLRFPEFRGEWEKYELGDICETITDFVAAGSFASLRENVKYYQEDNYAQLVRTVDLKKKFTNNDFVYVDEFAYDFLWRVQLKEPNIVLPNIGANIGEKYYVSPKDLPKEKNVLGPNAILLRSKCNDTHFVYFRLSTSSYDNEMKKLVGASGQPKFNKTDLKKVRLFIPSLKEQKKISYFLGLLEERIATQNKIIEDLKLLRDAISDAMFCTPKQSAPRKRIKGFYSDWQKVHLKDICSRVSQKNTNGRCDLVLTIAAKYGLVSQLDFFNKSVASENLEGYYLLQKRDFAYNKSYSSEYTCGAVKRLERYEEGVLSPLYICFRPDPSKVNSDYLSYYFESTKWYREIMDISVEGARNHGLLNISVVDYFNTIHRIPNMDEQKCIANVVKAIMHKISSEQTILDCYIKQRIFLLRQMFI